MSPPLVLLYHIIARRPADADVEERGLFVDPTAFRQQMDDLVMRGFTTMSLAQFGAALEGTPRPPKSVLLTFDDAYAHVDEVVSPVLRRHGFSAVMFACPAHLGAKNSWDTHHPNLSKLDIASKGQLQVMAEGPWEIASHARRHVDLRGLSQQERRADLRESRAEISEIVGKPVTDLAYPYGFDDAAVRADVRATGYRTAFTMGHTTGDDAFHLPRRPIRGTDSLTVFRMKTSVWSEGVYRVRDFAPDWARSAARTLLGAGAR